MGNSATRKSETGAPDWSELAAKLLDLWQDHLTAVAADPDLAAQALRLLAVSPAQGGVQTPGAGGSWFQNPWAQSLWGAAAAAPGGMTVVASEAQSDAATKKTGAPTVAAAPDAGALALGELGDRLASIEERLGAIERAAGLRPAKARRKTGDAARHGKKRSKSN